jgi:hypothetical protein
LEAEIPIIKDAFQLLLFGKIKPIKSTKKQKIAFNQVKLFGFECSWTQVKLKKDSKSILIATILFGTTIKTSDK